MTEEKARFLDWLNAPLEGNSEGWSYNDFVGDPAIMSWMEVAFAAGWDAAILQVVKKSLDNF